MKNISHKGKGTRKNNTNKNIKKSFSIPEIKQCFDSLSKETHRILQKGETTSLQVKEFQKVFKSLFHHPVSTESAETYLGVQRLLASKRVSRKTRKMKGGASVVAQGAPIDSITQPGISGVHGSFPAYQSQGLAFYDIINKQGMYQECGTKDITPQIGSSMGSNRAQSGGKLSDVAHLAEYSPISSSSPPSMLQGVTDSLKGFPPTPSSDPTNNPRITL
jgi:HAMP domain-containing protein